MRKIVVGTVDRNRESQVQHTNDTCQRAGGRTALGIGQSTLPKCSIRKDKRPAYTSALQYRPRNTLGTGTKHTVYAVCVSHIDHHASCGDRATLLPRCPPVAARLPRQGDVGSRGDDAVVPPKQGRRPTHLSGRMAMLNQLIHPKLCSWRACPMSLGRGVCPDTTLAA